MAIIPCPECEKEVSSRAVFCPFCGYPISGEQESGFVRIRTPSQLVGAPKHTFRKTMVTIRTEEGILWTGELGSIAKFRAKGPTAICIHMGNNARELKAIVYPFTDYRMSYLYSRWWNLPEYELIEI